MAGKVKNIILYSVGYKEALKVVGTGSGLVW